MPKFTFQVDRLHQVVSPIKLFPTVELTGEAFEVPVGSRIVYRGIVELGGLPRYTFDMAERKGWSGDRNQIENALNECFDDMVQI